MDDMPARGVDEPERPRASAGVNGKDSRAVMDVAVFRLSKRFSRAGETIRYELPDGYLEVSAGPAGMASIWDYDLVLMLVSQVTEAMNRYRAGKGAKPGRVLRPRVTEILNFCRRKRGGKRPDDLVAACLRLNTTHIAMERRAKTEAGRMVRMAEGEPLISRYRIILGDTGTPEYIEIEMAEWMYREITAGRSPNVLTVHPDYFRINLGIGRFVYRLARQSAGTATRGGYSVPFTNTAEARVRSRSFVGSCAGLSRRMICRNTAWRRDRDGAARF